MPMRDGPALRLQSSHLRTSRRIGNGRSHFLRREHEICGRYQCQRWRSCAEIEEMVMRYGAKSFAAGLEVGRAMVVFDINNRRLRFVLPLPDQTSTEFTRKKRYDKIVDCAPEETIKKWEQACRQRWCALLLVIKAKLEAVESGISTFDHEFLANIVQKNGMTIGEAWLPKLQGIIDSSKMPPLLPGPAVLQPGA